MTATRLKTGYAALSDDDDGLTTVSGVAIGENDITRGGSGKETLWPRETLEQAAEMFEGQPIATDYDHTADEPKSQTPVEAKIGEIDWAGYKPGVGVLYEGKINDEDIAEKIEHGWLEVSPLVFRDIEEHDGEEAAFKATNIQHVRDLATVNTGAAPSNEITVGGNSMKAEALHETVESMQDAPNQTMGAESPADTTQSMTDRDLTKEEESILSAAEDLESPVEALKDYGAAEQPSIVDEEQNEVLETEEYEALRAQVDEVESIMSEALAERTDLKESTIEALSFEALAEEFRDDEGDLKVEALVQEPETGEPDADETPEALSAEEQEQVDLLEERVETFESRGWEAAAEHNKEKIAEITGDDTILED